MSTMLGHRVVTLVDDPPANIADDMICSLVTNKHASLLCEIDQSEARYDRYYRLTVVDGIVIHAIVDYEMGSGTYVEISIDVDLAVEEDASWDKIAAFIQMLSKELPAFGSLCDMYRIDHVKYLVDINMSEINESSDDWVGLLSSPRYLPDSKLYRTKMPYNGSVRSSVNKREFYYICKAYCSTFGVDISTRPDVWNTSSADIVRFYIEYQPSRSPTIARASNEVMNLLFSHQFNQENLVWCYRLTIGWGEYCTIHEIQDRIHQQMPDRENELIRQILHFNKIEISHFPYNAAKGESEALTKLMNELEQLDINVIITPDKHRRCLLRMWMDHFNILESTGHLSNKNTT